MSKLVFSYRIWWVVEFKFEIRGLEPSPKAFVGQSLLKRCPRSWTDQWSPNSLFMMKILISDPFINLIESEIWKIFSKIYSKTRSGEWMNIRPESEVSFKILVGFLISLMCPISLTDQWSQNFKFHDQLSYLWVPFKIFVTSEAEISLVCSEFFLVPWSG